MTFYMSLTRKVMKQVNFVIVFSFAPNYLPCLREHGLFLLAQKMMISSLFGLSEAQNLAVKWVICQLNEDLAVFTFLSYVQYWKPLDTLVMSRMSMGKKNALLNSTFIWLRLSKLQPTKVSRWALGTPYQCHVLPAEIQLRWLIGIRMIGRSDPKGIV